MQVKSRLFPYPVLNKNIELSNYKNKKFYLDFEKSIETETEYILKNLKFTTDSEILNKLFQMQKIGACIIIECSYTVYRQAIDISDIPKNIHLKKSDFTEKVDISMFMYAKEDFTLTSGEFDEDYSSLNFEIEKNDILAADDGFHVYFRHDETEDNLVKSIFSITVDHEMESGKYMVNCDIGKKIGIILSEVDYKNYKIIYTIPVYKEVFFNMLLVPSLIEALTKCREILNDEKDLDDVANQYYWFRSILSSYKKLTGNDLTLQDFKVTSPVDLAQDLLGKPLGESLKKLVDETNNGGNEDE